MEWAEAIGFDPLEAVRVLKQTARPRGRAATVSRAK
jgi:hypothetical protein